MAYWPIATGAGTVLGVKRKLSRSPETRQSVCLAMTMDFLREGGWLAMCVGSSDRERGH